MMKGLLLKDWYTIWSSTRIYLLMILAFAAAAGFFGGDNAFFRFYPLVLISVLPVTALSYDERSGWQRLAETMPYGRDRVVLSKYLLLLLALGVVMAVMTLSTAAVAAGKGTPLSGAALCSLLSMELLGGILPGAITLPAMFRFGVEKGRLVFMAVICGACIALGILVSSDISGLGLNFPAARELSLSLSMLGLSFGAFVLSLLLSLRAYRKRDL